MSIKQMVLSVPLLAPGLKVGKKTLRNISGYISAVRALKASRSYCANRIFYLGIPAHANLGDLAQGVCIREWLKRHYPDKYVVEIETNWLVNTYFSILDQLKKEYREGELIVFQSGYTTTDLGGYADDMHCAVISALPNAKFLMMPQTIFFVSDERKKRCSQIYNSAKNMLFLARDAVSYRMATEMFPDIETKLYPDIVTTMIGNEQYEHERAGICFCCRDDGEKYYSDSELNSLIARCGTLDKVTVTDTTKHGRTKEIVANARTLVKNEIDSYAQYKLIVTDRYHGTIFSLAAGTPVIILKTTDHKVITGADWFKGIYDDYVYVAKDLEDAYNLAEKVLGKSLDNKLTAYFEKNYYDKLPEYIDGSEL